MSSMRKNTNHPTFGIDQEPGDFLRTPGQAKALAQKNALPVGLEYTRMN